MIKKISLYKYLRIVNLTDTFDIVSEVFDCNAKDLAYDDFCNKCSQLKDMIAVDAKNGILRGKVGKYTLIPNANKLKASAFIDLCEYQKQNDLIHCVGIMYGATTDDECKEVCELLSIDDGVALIRFFYLASNELLKCIQSSSEEAQTVKKHLQLAIAQIQLLGLI